jgi:translation elongation factor P/translation initiation factor 5A
MGATLRGGFSGYSRIEEGFFQVLSRSERQMTVVDLEDLEKMKYQVKLVGDGQHYVHEGMLLSAIIGCKQKHTWELIHVERVFPKAAADYLG